MWEIRSLRARWRGRKRGTVERPAGAPVLGPTDERGWETGHWPWTQATAPILHPTTPKQEATSMLNRRWLVEICRQKVFARGIKCECALHCTNQE